MIFNTTNEVYRYLANNNIGKASVNDNLTVDIDGDYTMKTPLDIHINTVNGNFTFKVPNTVSLDGCPNMVTNDFKVDSICSHIESLRGSPQYIGGSFHCTHTNIKSLEFFPQHVERNINLSSNCIESLKYIQKHVRGWLIVNNNEIQSLEHMPLQIDGFFNIMSNPIKDLTPILHSKIDNIICSVKFLNDPIYKLWKVFQQMQ